MVFAPPDAQPLRIELAPRLESWMRRDHADQVRLREYLDWLKTRVAPTLGTADNALALRVALPSGTPLDAGGFDLDNFLHPVVRALGHARFVSVWGSKMRAPSSTITTAPARPAQQPSDGSWCFAWAESSQPKDTIGWKEDIDA